MARQPSLRRGFALASYLGLTRVLSFLAPLLINVRRRQNKELPGRECERLGYATKPRPEGTWIWFHCASLGESSVVKIVIDAWRARGMTLPVLVTTTTKSSALYWDRLNLENVTHQFAPVDFPVPCARFLHHWRPAIGLFVESELWPNLLRRACAHGVKLALINARMNAKSLRFWSFWARDCRSLLSCFSWIGVADRATFRGLQSILSRVAEDGFEKYPQIELAGNLKAALSLASLSQAQQAILARLQAATSPRFVWLGASTHIGEEEILLRAHRLLRQDAPDALLILAPRKPERGAELAALGRREGFSFTRWSELKTLDGAQAVLIADSLGEMDLWLSLCQAVFMGGSLIPRYRGHNPMEAIAHKRAIMVGPHFDSFADLYKLLFDHDLATIVGDADHMAARLRAGMMAASRTETQERIDEVKVANVLLQGRNAIHVTTENLDALIQEVHDARS